MKNFAGLAFICLLGLAACQPRTPEPPIVPSVRDQTAPIASQSDVDLARLIGTWRVVQGAGSYPKSDVAFTEESVTFQGKSYPLQSLGHGRFSAGDRAIWVHWMDGDNRTAAIGDPTGSHVWIMDRAGLHSERVTAARRILEWYGYDLDRLQ